MTIVRAELETTSRTTRTRAWSTVGNEREPHETFLSQVTAAMADTKPEETTAEALDKSFDIGGNDEVRATGLG